MVKSLLCCLALACTGGILLAQSKSVPAEYTFKVGVTYEMKMEEGKTNDMVFWFSNADYSGVGMGEQKGMMMVYDMGRKIMVTFMEAQKMYMVMDMDKMRQKAGIAEQDTEEAAKKAAKDIKITKTGKTETILGYKCDQYEVLSKSNRSLIWVTTELGSGFGNLMKNLSLMMRGAAGGFGEAGGIASGVMLKMEGTDLSTHKSYSLTAKSVNKQGMVIQTAGYRAMNMPGQ